MFLASVATYNILHPFIIKIIYSYYTNNRPNSQSKSKKILTNKAITPKPLWFRGYSHLPVWVFVAEKGRLELPRRLPDLRP